MTNEITQRRSELLGDYVALVNLWVGSGSMNGDARITTFDNRLSLLLTLAQKEAYNKVLLMLSTKTGKDLEAVADVIVMLEEEKEKLND